jgi:hypothetical protein
MVLILKCGLFDSLRYPPIVGPDKQPGINQSFLNGRIISSDIKRQHILMIRKSSHTLSLDIFRSISPSRYSVFQDDRSPDTSGPPFPLSWYLTYQHS